MNATIRKCKVCNNLLLKIAIISYGLLVIGILGYEVIKFIHFDLQLI